MKWLLIFLVNAVVLTAGFAKAQDVDVAIGARYWNVNIAADDASGDGHFWGPVATVRFMEKYFVAGASMFGDEEYDDGATTDVTSGDIIIGMRFDAISFLDGIDVGAGYWYWKNDWGVWGTADEKGPVLAARTTHTLEQSGIQLYGDVKWNFYDYGDFETLESYILEGGISYDWQQLALSLGYKFKHYYNDDLDYRYGGIIGSAIYLF